MPTSHTEKELWHQIPFSAELTESLYWESKLLSCEIVFPETDTISRARFMVCDIERQYSPTLYKLCALMCITTGPEAHSCANQQAWDGRKQTVSRGESFLQCACEHPAHFYRWGSHGEHNISVRNC